MGTAGQLTATASRSGAYALLLKNLIELPPASSVTVTVAVVGLSNEVPVTGTAIVAPPLIDRSKVRVPLTSAVIVSVWLPAVSAVRPLTVTVLALVLPMNLTFLPPEQAVQ